MALRDGFECCPEIGVGLDTVELACLNQCGDAPPCSATLIMAREECVLTIEGNRPDGAFDHIAVHLDSSVLKEELQPLHVLGNVAELLTQPGLCGDPGTNGSEPVFKVSQKRRGFSWCSARRVSADWPLISTSTL